MDIRGIIFSMMLCFLVACGGNDGVDINRPLDQAFHGGDSRGEDLPALKHLITQVTVLGSMDETCTVTVNALVDTDPNPIKFERMLNLDDFDLAKDSGIGGATILNLLDIEATDILNNESRFQIEFNINP